MIAVGPFTATAIIDRTQDLNSHWAYKAVFTAQFGVAGIAAVLVWFVPESPVWLMRIGNDFKARRSLFRLGYMQTLEVDTEITRIRNALDKEIQDGGVCTSYLECFRRSDLRRTIISVMPLAIQALGGQFFFAFYFAYYTQLVGYSVHDSFHLQFIQYAFVIIANVCSWYLVEKLGRRALTIYGTLALTVVMILCGGLGIIGSPIAIKGTVATFILYGFFFNVGIGATGFTILCEVASYRLRGKTIALGISLQHLVSDLCLPAYYRVFEPLVSPQVLTSMADQLGVGMRRARHDQPGSCQHGGPGCVCLRGVEYLVPDILVVLPGRD